MGAEAGGLEAGGEPLATLEEGRCEGTARPGPIGLGNGGEAIDVGGDAIGGDGEIAGHGWVSPHTRTGTLPLAGRDGEGVEGPVTLGLGFDASGTFSGPPAPTGGR